MNQDFALVALLQDLASRHYRWVTPTPETQRRVRLRPDRQVAVDLAGIFGWSLPFAPEIVDPGLLALMREGGIVVEHGNLLASTLRVSSLDDLLFLHSAYPTTESDAVFFGPDTYRFARFVKTALAGTSPSVERLVDIGAGSGAGGIVAAHASGAAEIFLTDINPRALRLSRINAEAAGITVRAVSSDILHEVAGSFDLVIANPPYMVDADRRAYRHGGEALGAGLSLRIAREAADRLTPGGQLLLYTASAIVDGEDAFRSAVLPALEQRNCSVAYEEIDPDVFGEELERPVYGAVDRIAVVGVRAMKRALQ
jgi:SAM-dependent methyltransferase